ncbi:hypothetical protein [Pedobacter chinensis]|uniref:hypothetical protein n=1 Tax=Pedobacter chinensis TaxID=2282421 RepID=UPI0011C04DAF|nr:hypothetical protein [Pedobacter chinensis]
MKPLFDYSSTAFIDRNYSMGKIFLMQYEAAKKQYANGKKALVILNTYHGYTHIPAFQPLPARDLVYSAAEMIRKSLSANRYRYLY